jgi:hypothetical protein
MSDREPFEQARAHGLVKRHETRLAKHSIEVPFVAQNIVNQLADLWEVPVETRQATNDRCDQFVTRLIKVHVETREARAIRKQVAEDLRFLAAARKDYCARCPEHQGDMHEMGNMALAIHEEHMSASWLADIIDGKNDAKGWLPSWRWDEWKARSITTQETPS